ncbi:hypothetical protein ASC97_29805 [Rhizobium sp. Root1203]|nr:hypothetical protein ASC97_29805 [Rhizobium sp. Root1203]
MKASISKAATFMRQRLHPLAKVMVIAAPGFEAAHEGVDIQSGDVHAPAPSSAREGHGHRCAWFRNGSSSGKSPWLYTPAVRSSGGDPSDE